MSSPPVLSVNDLTFQWKSREVLHRISFTLSRAQIGVILGANGSGKSTLLKLIGKIHPLQHGAVCINGDSIANLSAPQIAVQVGYVPQSIEGVIPFSVRQLLSLSCYPLAKSHLFPSLSKQNQEERIENVMTDFSLQALSERPFGALSGGERQRVLLAASVVHRPSLILLDEPTAHLDPNYAAEFEESLLRLNKQQGISLLMVTHDVNSRLLSCADTVLGLKQGRMLLQGVPHEVLSADGLRALYSHNFLFLNEPTSGRTIMVPE